ncbi:unnamed protein product, partial [Amoebophrya sp. A25]
LAACCNAKQQRTGTPACSDREGAAPPTSPSSHGGRGRTGGLLKPNKGTSKIKGSSSPASSSKHLTAHQRQATEVAQMKVGLGLTSSPASYSRGASAASSAYRCAAYLNEKPAEADSYELKYRVYNPEAHTSEIVDVNRLRLISAPVISLVDTFTQILLSPLHTSGLEGELAVSAVTVGRGRSFDIPGRDEEVPLVTTSRDEGGPVVEEPSSPSDMLISKEREAARRQRAAEGSPDPLDSAEAKRVSDIVLKHAQSPSETPGASSGGASHLHISFSSSEHQSRKGTDDEEAKSQIERQHQHASARVGTTDAVAKDAFYSTNVTQSTIATLIKRVVNVLQESTAFGKGIGQAEAHKISDLVSQMPMPESTSANEPRTACTTSLEVARDEEEQEEVRWSRQVSKSSEVSSAGIVRSQEANILRRLHEIEMAGARAPTEQSSNVSDVDNVTSGIADLSVGEDEHREDDHHLQEGRGPPPSTAAASSNEEKMTTQKTSMINYCKVALHQLRSPSVDIHVSVSAMHRFFFPDADTRRVNLVWDVHKAMKPAVVFRMQEEDDQFKLARVLTARQLAVSSEKYHKVMQDDIDLGLLEAAEEMGLSSTLVFPADKIVDLYYNPIFEDHGDAEGEDAEDGDGISSLSSKLRSATLDGRAETQPESKGTSSVPTSAVASSMITGLTGTTDRTRRRAQAGGTTVSSRAPEKARTRDDHEVAAKQRSDSTSSMQAISTTAQATSKDLQKSDPDAIPASRTEGTPISTPTTRYRNVKPTLTREQVERIVAEKKLEEMESGAADEAAKKQNEKPLVVPKGVADGEVVDESRPKMAYTSGARGDPSPALPSVAGMSGEAASSLGNNTSHGPPQQSSTDPPRELRLEAPGSIREFPALSEGEDKLEALFFTLRGESSFDERTHIARPQIYSRRKDAGHVGIVEPLLAEMLNARGLMGMQESLLADHGAAFAKRHGIQASSQVQQDASPNSSGSASSETPTGGTGQTATEQAERKRRRTQELIVSRTAASFVLQIQSAFAGSRYPHMRERVVASLIESSRTSAIASG